jgi:hypothetical protein
VVGTDQPEQLRVRVPIAEGVHRVDRVAHPAAGQFIGVHLDAGLASQGSSQHPQTSRIGCWTGTRLEGGLGGRDEEQAIERQFLEGRLRDEQMSPVQGIE